MSYYYTPKLTQSEAERIGRIERRHPDPTLPGPDEPANLEHAEIAHARIHERAEAFIREDILCCDSWLIPDLAKAFEPQGIAEGFGYDDWENLYPDQDADDWTLEECRDWLDEHGGDAPDDSADVEDWRDAVRDADPSPAEPYEWWRVSQWLCEKLRDAGEVVIDNGYGQWWGRCCTGQSIILDGTIQRIAHGLLASR